MANSYRSLTETEKMELSQSTQQLKSVLPLKDVVASLYPPTQEAVKPGDLICFFYNGELRSGLVVRSKKAPSGYFKAVGTGNNLLNVFSMDLTGITEDTSSVILRNLYRNRVACSYKYSNKVLSMYLGSANFRTFNFDKMASITQILITDDESVIGGF